MKLKFTRNVAVYAVHREQGSVHDIADREAIQLIADGVAVAVKAAPAIESAEAPMAARESAAIKTRKGK